ncbi:MAG: ABC transporter permease [Anaerolineales bacterium]|nr:ABC transporter permease [Anaerolineales bacterium]
MMPPLLRYILIRLLFIPITLIVITALLYGFVMLTPPEVRATLFLPVGGNPERMTAEQIQRLTERIIREHHLNDPYPVQYVGWVAGLVRGEWGWSPVLKQDVLAALVRRTPVTIELTLYAVLLFVPLGMVNGVLAGWRKNRITDHIFRLSAFTATSLPIFVLAQVLMAIFYVVLGWFPPERLSMENMLLVRLPEFHAYTGLVTVDGFLNGRVDISLDAFRHLVLPVISLSLLHWATLGRVTRASMIEELGKDYTLAAKARGLSNQEVVWKHAFRNALTPSLTSSALSAASLFTGVFVIERIYNFKGISDLVVISVYETPDAALVLGFAVYSVCIVLMIMVILDILQGLFDPRVREGILQT